MSRMNPSSRRTAHGLFGAAFLGGVLLAGAPDAMAAALERAEAAAARGDLRAAQIEWRNAVREEPASAARRASLAATSLELGDGETAEREARAALERGYDPAAGTTLLMRAYLLAGRFNPLLDAFPEPGPGTPAGGQVAAGRALAQLALGRKDEARETAELAVRLAPGATQPELAAAAVAAATGDRAGAEARVDAVLARDPASIDALVRKGVLLLDRNEARAAAETFGRIVAIAPGNVPARLRRAEILLRLNQAAEAKQDIDAALAVLPGSVAGHYLRAMLLAQSRDWAGVDAEIQRIGPVLGDFPDGYLLQAMAKRGLGQTAQAEDAARRHLARRPDDPRGARLVAAFDLAANRLGDATAVLTRLAERGGADAESLDLLGRLHGAAGRRQEAIAAFERAAGLAPQNAEILSHLAAARLVAGDVAGTAATAGEVLRADPSRHGARELLAFAALYRGDLATVRSELERLDPAARDGEAAGVLAGTAQLMQLQLEQSRATFTKVLADHPNSVPARLGLVRLARIGGQPAEAERLLGEALRAVPGNAEAAAQLAAAAMPGSPRAAEARAVLAQAQAAAPGDARLALLLAHVLMRHGEAAQAAEVLTAGPLLREQHSPALLIARADAHAAADQWALAEAASRQALAETPDSTVARQQLAGILVHAGDLSGAETLIQLGLRRKPGDAALQATLATLVLRARGTDAALELADRLARQAEAQPASRTLRGDLLMAAERPQDAAQAFAAAYAETPSAPLALRLARARIAARQFDEAALALRDWLQREPANDDALLLLSQLDIGAGRLEEAETRLGQVVAHRPDDAVALNNLAWLLGQRNDATARALAERAYYLAPNIDTADTLGWILARGGQPAQAVPLLRQAAVARAAMSRPDPAASFRLAYALQATGAREEALSVLAPVMSDAQPFAERAEAERLLRDLRGGR
ncbi:putative PEP-CTERM system TPR-repeat lipoprotein [Humitalea rosea]|uniref:Putative PEP-CTERM system TPR-repeat lipoprotein n=1 Tax=Humitalea rosea TaxID=990373 RepID=A0A2W7IIR7_9PROT|nr:XrtA/PEP-CTERM system TPR-repeat protein PrsT [Humitalea rosea]PZW46785.1 putative PEP-CTERM system TPR-repeat lipoprotein [Humitalea rosea]